MEKYHPVLKLMTGDEFSRLRLKQVLEALTDAKLPGNHDQMTIEWRHFAELQIVSSKYLRILVGQADSYQIARTFVEAFLGIRHEDYFRD